MKKLLFSLFLIFLSSASFAAWQKRKYMYVKPPPNAVLDFNDPINNQLAAFWMVGEGGGTFVKDLTRKHNGTFKGTAPLWAPGKDGVVGNFDGSTDFVDILNTGALDITGNNFTLSSWAYWTRTTHVNDFAISTYNGAGGYGQGFSFESSVTNVKSFNFPNGVLVIPLAPVTINSNQWYNIVTTHDGNNLRQYLNGILLKTTVAVGANTSSGQNVQIGQLPTSGALFGGRIDNVRIWTRTLNQAEIMRLFVDRWAGLATYSFDVMEHPPSVSFNPTGTFILKNGLMKVKNTLFKVVN